MSDERKTIREITRTSTSLDGTESFVGQDDTGDFQATLTTLLKLMKYNVLEIDDEDYTIGDTDLYGVYVFKNLTTDRTLNFPTLLANIGKEFHVINASGAYDVNCSPEGSDYLNDWQVDFPITEKGGEIKFLATAAKWAGTPLNDACIYEVSTETADTGLSLTGAWDDVSSDGGATAMTLLNGVYGYGDLEASAHQDGRDTSNPAYIQSGFGIGKTSGNNAPDIPGAFDYYNLVQVVANAFESLINTRRIKCKYESDGSALYMKSQITSNEMNITTHAMYGNTDCPMYIKFVRKY